MSSINIIMFVRITPQYDAPRESCLSYAKYTVLLKYTRRCIKYKSAFQHCAINNNNIPSDTCIYIPRTGLYFPNVSREAVEIAHGLYVWPDETGRYM